MKCLGRLAIASLFLAACDGGGGGGNPNAVAGNSSEDATADTGTPAVDATSPPPEAGAVGADGPARAEVSSPPVPLDCGAPGVTTHATGTVGGVLVGSTEAIGAYGIDSTTGVPYAGILIWNRTGTCALLQSGMAPPSATTVLTIEVARTDGPQPIGPGTYAYGADNGAPTNGIALFVHFASTDASCVQVLEDGVNGTVTLDAVCGSTVAGSFALDLSLGGDAGVDHISGTFNAPVCNFDMSTFDPNMLPAGCIGSTAGDP